MPTAYPLAWPDGWPRTAANTRTSSRYQVHFNEAVDDLAREIDLFGSSEFPIVSSNRPTSRRDGMPSAQGPGPRDPGVAVYWSVREGGVLVPRVVACDRWSDVRSNIRACGLSIGALRQIERCGASQILARAFLGLTALPASTTRTWQEVLGFADPVLTRVALRQLTAEQIKLRWRELARERHPDLGGTHEGMLELNNARDEALAWLATQP